MNDLSDRIKEAAEEIGGLNQLSAEAKVPRRTLGSWLEGRSPKPKALEAIAKATGVRLAWLMSGDGPKRDEAPVEEPIRPRHLPPRSEPRPPATIKFYPIRLSAGGGSTTLHESPGSDFSLEEMASNLLGVPVANIFLCRIYGDSMYPTLADGDVAVIDNRHPVPDNGGIYAFAFDGEVRVKRAHWVGGRTLQWHSDNPDPRYGTITVAGDDQEQMRSLGRVIWVWKPIE